MSIELRFDQPFEEAVEYFKGKGIALSPGGWRDLREEAHAKAFTVARVADEAMLAEIKEMVLKAQAEGITLKQFADELIPRLEKRGWLAPGNVSGVAPSRLKVIYGTNIGTAYNVGRYRQMMETAVERPYRRYMGVDDPSTRDRHRDQFGKVYPQGHSFWEYWWPPNGFQCRCYVQALSAADVAKHKYRIEDKNPLKRDKAGRWVMETPDAGFMYNAGRASSAEEIEVLSGDGLRRILLVDESGGKGAVEVVREMLEGFLDDVATLLKPGYRDYCRRVVVKGSGFPRDDLMEKRLGTPVSTDMTISGLDTVHIWNKEGVRPDTFIHEYGHLIIRNNPVMGVIMKRAIRREGFYTKFGEWLGDASEEYSELLRSYALIKDVLLKALADSHPNKYYALRMALA